MKSFKTRVKSLVKLKKDVFLLSFDGLGLEKKSKIWTVLAY